MNRLNVVRNGLLALAIVGLSGAAETAFSQTSKQAPVERSCFYPTQWHGWKSPSPDVIYLHVDPHDVYRVDLSSGSRQLSNPDVHLVTEIRGASTICSALDLDLSIADNNGFREPLIAKSLTRLSPAEVAALPRKFRP